MLDPTLDPTRPSIWTGLVLMLWISPSTVNSSEISISPLPVRIVMYFITFVHCMSYPFAMVIEWPRLASFCLLNRKRLSSSVNTNILIYSSSKRCHSQIWNCPLELNSLCFSSCTNREYIWLKVGKGFIIRMLPLIVASLSFNPIRNYISLFS